MRHRLLALAALAMSTLTPQSAATTNTIEGRVVHAITREPIRNAIVVAPGTAFESTSVGEAAAMTDATGRFTLRATSPPVRLTVTKTTYLETRVSLGSERGPLEIALTPAASITGRVLDPSGDPVRGAAVRAQIKGETREAMARMTATDDRGWFCVDGLAAGEFVVTAGRTSGAAMQRPHPAPNEVTLVAGEERDGVDLQVSWASMAPSPFSGMAMTPGPLPVGTASIAGTVRDGRGRTVSSVFVSAWPATRPLGADTPTWNVVTDERGAFVIDKLPAGSYRVVVHRLTTSGGMGTTMVSEPTTPLGITDGQQLYGLDLRVRSGGAISGTVRDEHGDPSRAAMTLFSVEQNRATRYSFDPTDDRGRYRFADLRPGHYVVMATPAFPTPVLSPDGGGGARLLGRMPAFHPGVPGLLDATLTVLETDAEATADVLVSYEPVADVMLSLTGVAGDINKIEGRQLALQERLPEQFIINKGLDAVLFGSVPAGRWNFGLRAEVSSTSGVESMWALQEITTDGVTPHRTTLTLQPGARMSGRLLHDGNSAAVTDARVSLGYVGTALSSSIGRFNEFAASPAKGTAFDIRNIMPGNYVIQTASVRPDGPRLMRATMNGRDVLDLPIALGPAAQVTDVVLTMTTRSTSVTGVVNDASGRPLPNVDVMIIAADRRYHYPHSRRIVTVRSSTDGTYAVRGLPAGEYRLGLVPRATTVAALLEPPRSLPRLAITLADGEQKIQNISGGR
jgi:hypothetical protein